MDDAVLTVLFFATALLYSIVGHAGASGYLAAMAVMGTAPALMRPTALTLNILVATIATIRFARAGCFSWRLFWPFVVLSVPFAYLGGTMTLPVPMYRKVVGAVLLYAAYHLFRRAGDSRSGAVDAPPPAVSFPLGGVIGMLSGLTGVGGGIFLSPVILLMRWADAKVTAGVSAAFILVNSIAGLLGHLGARPSLHGSMAAWVAAVVAGGAIGSHLGAKRFAGPTIRRLLAAILVLAGAKLMIQ
ncbi:MAG: sulfite exporter TauE/SafE family protein [Planctomycetes bacterium]|nr:sulfite exporter TauE/SafE family protein [Planctomycetota bacterium]